jgi:hypothetical protein
MINYLPYPRNPKVRQNLFARKRKPTVKGEPTNDKGDKHHPW